MVNSPFCEYCTEDNVVETIKHILWDCPRASRIWESLNIITSRAFNLNYMTYNTIILGSEKPIFVLETLILVALKLILTKDRSTAITREVLESKIKLQFILEQKAMKDKTMIFQNRWAGLREILSINFD